VCGSASSRTVYAEARDPITGDAFRVDRCGQCGVAYTAPRPVALDRYYPQRYRSYGPAVLAVLGALYGLRVRRWARLRAGGGSVLEVGCGPGLMLAQFRRRGWRALGIERNEAAAETGRRLLGVEIVATPVEELPEEARFDLIVLFHVLEHIAAPVALLEQCARRLAPGGRVIVNVPNFASWQSRFGGPRWLNLDVPRHLVHYTPETLAGTFERAGLRMESVSYASLEHDPYGWIESAISRWTGRHNTLTRYLMGLDPLSVRVALAFLLGAVMAVPAVALAGASWAAGSGAVMEAIAAVGPEHK